MKLLPDCMMPDGADPCKGYQEIYNKHKRLCELIETMQRTAENDCDGPLTVGIGKAPGVWGPGPVWREICQLASVEIKHGR